jgi:hypothetical protein
MPTPIHAKCPEKVALLSAYQERTAKYSEAVSELRRIMGTSSRADYDAKFGMTEALRIDAREALKDLEDHVADHSC